MHRIIMVYAIHYVPKTLKLEVIHQTDETKILITPTKMTSRLIFTLLVAILLVDSLTTATSFCLEGTVYEEGCHFCICKMTPGMIKNPAATEKYQTVSHFALLSY